MSDLSARLDLPLIKPSQAQKHVTHNEALQLLDGLVQAVLEETGVNTPPFEPVTGRLYALGASPTDDWAGQAGQLALRVAEAWLFLAPREGWRAWDKAAGQFKVFDGTDWAEVVPGLDNLDGVGIGTASDATNKLAVASEASLFSHAGAGHQMKVNKASAGDTASLLFQSNWTGHAEMGLAGDTAFSIKVSDDGSVWHDAMKADAAAQEVAIGFQVVGDAVQQDPTDTMPGRLMRADFGYGPGNLLGTVGQAAGIPTGAVIERGSNANGDYVRFADGTQICCDTVSLTYASANILSCSWNFPAVFSEAPFRAVNLSNQTGDYTNVFLRDVGQLVTFPTGTSSAVFNLYRVQGAAGTWDGTSEANNVKVFAFGRWF